MVKKTVPTQKILIKIGINKGLLGINIVAATMYKKRKYFAGHTLRLKVGLSAVVIAARMKKIKANPAPR